MDQCKAPSCFSTRPATQGCKKTDKFRLDNTVQHAGWLEVTKRSLRDIAAAPYRTNTDGIIMSVMLTF
jgi:hypothetical protein